MPDISSALAVDRWPPRSKPYLPIEDYALIGDTHTAALVARDGAIDWLCLPMFADPALFSAILDSERGGTFFAGAPVASRIARRYLPGTAVLETTFTTDDGVLRITDLMPVADDPRQRTLRPRRRLLRLVEAVSGRPELAVRFAPRPTFGSRPARLRRAGRTAWTVADGRDWLLLQSDVELQDAAESTLTGRVRLTAGDRRVLALNYSCSDIGVLLPLSGAQGECERTVAFWRGYSDACTYDGPYAEQVRRSAITLRLLTYSQTGAVIAAPTTSLPEAIGGRRNWDYRFCWLRDASFIIDGFLSLGYRPEAAGFFNWLIHATQLTAPELGVMYDVYGHTKMPEFEVKSLEGYRGSAPVRVGNAAQTQLQLDVYGEMATSAKLFVEHGGHLDFTQGRRLRQTADIVCRQWTLPDNGMWELRGGRQHHTHSKAMCWAALVAVSDMIEAGHFRGDAKRYRREADAIRENILHNAWSESRQALTGAYGRKHLDANLLLLPRIGLIDASDPRMVATFDAIDRELGDGARVRRYVSGFDGFPSTEGAFTACGFWAVDCLARRGDLDQAHSRFASLCAQTNDVGLMSEESDPETGAMLGNFPQAFSHAGLISAALSLQAARKGDTR